MAGEARTDWVSFSIVEPVRSLGVWLKSLLSMDERVLGDEDLILPSTLSIPTVLLSVSGRPCHSKLFSGHS